MNLCKDCRHADFYSDSRGMCHHPNNGNPTDCVTGRRRATPCHVARSGLHGVCGVSASLFEPHPPTYWQRLKAWWRALW
jgi:hypothetical protein